MPSFARKEAPTRLPIALALAAWAVLVAGSGAAPTQPGPAGFVRSVDNPWFPLGVVDHKLYVHGVGLVLDQTIRGGDERNALVARRR